MPATADVTCRGVQLKFPLREICKRVQAVRWPDGREDPAHFRSDLSKWVDLLDEDDSPVMLVPEPTHGNENPTPYAALPCASARLLLCCRRAKAGRTAM